MVGVVAFWVVLRGFRGNLYLPVVLLSVLGGFAWNSVLEGFALT